MLTALVRTSAACGSTRSWLARHGANTFRFGPTNGGAGAVLPWTSVMATAAASAHATVPAAACRARLRRNRRLITPTSGAGACCTGPSQAAMPSRSWSSRIGRLLSAGGEFTFQALAPGHQTGLDRPWWQAPLGGDAFSGHVGEVVQDQDLALAQRQPHQRAVQVAERHPVAWFARWCLAGPGQPGRQPYAAAQPPARVHREPQRHLPHPVLRHVIGAQPGPAGEGTREGFLRGVLRLLPVAEHAKQQRHDAAVAGLVKALELAGTSHRLLLGERLAHAGLGRRSAIW